MLLMWLIVQRLKENATPVVVAAQGNVIDSPEYQSLFAQYEALQNSLANAGDGGGGDHKALHDKIQYLESKLLEYEILQEEIGTLSNLKVENERLREMLVKAGIKAPDVEKTATPSTDTKDSTTEDIAPPVLEQAAEPVVEPAAQVEASEPVVEAPHIELPTSAPNVEAASPEASLDSLLLEIDKLTDEHRP